MKKVIDLIKQYELEDNVKEHIPRGHADYYVITVGFYTIEISEEKDTEWFMHTIDVWNNKPHNSRPVKEYKNHDTEHFIEEVKSTFKKFIRLDQEDRKNKVVAVVRKSAHKDLIKELPELFERDDVIIVVQEDEEFDKIMEMQSKDS